jgi:uncharacterized membrane protein YphA (DoxX/SURF4 family)
MSPKRSRFDRWIFESYVVTPDGLGLYRIAFSLFALLFLMPGAAEYVRFSFLGGLPDVFFLPPVGPMQWAGGFPPDGLFGLLEALLILSLTAMLFGYYTRTASVATTLLFLVGYGFAYSLGKINHNILFVLLPLVMSFSNWGAAYSFDARANRGARTVASWPLVLLLLLTGFAMFTAGLPKILGGWLDPTTQATYGRFVRQFFVHGRRDLLAPLAIDLQSPVLWEVFDIVTVGFEIGFLFAVLHPLTTRVFAVGAIAFHTGITLVLNIAFVPNYIVYAAVLPWAAIAHALPVHAAVFRPLRRVPAWAYPGIVLATAATAFYAGSPLLWGNGHVPFTSDLTLSDLIALGLAWCSIFGTLAMWGKAPARTDRRGVLVPDRAPSYNRSP